MREISFRCWDVKLKRWEYWGLPEDAGYMAGRFNKKNATKKGRRFSTKTLCQFTGLHDKNGKEIYEGDIINLPDYQFNPVQASFMQGVFGVTGADSVHYPLRAFSKTGSSSIEIESPVEVIGNIYEHKHLLK